MENRKLLAGVLAGAAVGAIAGILFAPDKGSNTRGTISRRSRESVSGLRDKVNHLVETVADKYLSTDGRTASSSRPQTASSRRRAGSAQQKATGERSRPGNPAHSPEAL